MNDPHPTSAVLGGNTPAPKTCLVLGGFAGVKHRLATCPELEIHTPQAQELLAQLMLYYYSGSVPGHQTLREAEYRWLYLESPEIRLHLKTALSYNYPDPIRVVIGGSQRAGSLEHLGALWGDKVKFVPWRLSTDRLRLVARVLLSSALAVFEGQKPGVKPKTKIPRPARFMVSREVAQEHRISRTVDGRYTTTILEWGDGELDNPATRSLALAKWLSSWLKTHSVEKNLVIDFRGVELIPSSACAIWNAMQILQVQEGINVTYENEARECRRYFRLCQAIGSTVKTDVSNYLVASQ